MTDLDTTRTYKSDVLGLMNAKSKQDVEKRCRTLTITGSDFANVLLAVQVGSLAPYQYVSHSDHMQPSHLLPSDAELQALASNGIGPVKGKANKAVRKIGQLFAQRRLFVAHLIWHPSAHGWHLFYFDQRDLQREANHWKAGDAHIHYSRHGFVNADAKTVWAGILEKPPRLPKAIHVRFDRDK